MKKLTLSKGFSLVEILVSLLVVSLAAANISGLQKLIGDQSRDNFSHVAVVELVTDRLEQVKQATDLQEVIDLNNTTSTYNARGTEFQLSWDISTVSGALNTSPIRNVDLTVTWPDATGEEQTFTHYEQVSLTMLLNGGGGLGDFPNTIPNLLNTEKVSHFESKMGYKQGAYVIYDSQLFKATSVHSVGNGHQREVTAPIVYEEGEVTVSDGWEHLGRIDNADLASLFDDY